ALRTHGEGTEAAIAAFGAPLVEQAMLAASLPIGLTVEARAWGRDALQLGKQEAHGRSRPRSSTSQNKAPAPPFEQRATSTPVTWLVVHRPRICRAARMTRCSCCALIPG